METLVREITAYQFSELEKYAQEKAKGNYLAEKHLPEFFSADVVAELEEFFGLFHLNTCFSLSYSQGDGLCLYGQIEHSELFSNEKFKKIALKGIHYEQIQSIYYELQSIDFEHRSMYYYAKSVNIKSLVYTPSEQQAEIIEKIINNVETWYFSFCKEWENRGYAYFYELADSDMQEICENAEYLFTEDGQLIDRDIYNDY